MPLISLQVIRRADCIDRRTVSLVYDTLHITPATVHIHSSYTAIFQQNLAVATQVVKFLEEFNNLKAMGFASHIITGALIACPTDLAEATEACLSASS